MRFLSTITAGVFAAVASAQEPVTGPFYLTFVAENGTEYPATIGEASRGIKILSAWTEYNQQFTFEADTQRLRASDHPEWGPNVGLTDSSPVLFTTEVTGDDKLEQIEADGVAYIVKAGAGEAAIKGWNAPPVQQGLYDNVYWVGAGQLKDSVSALRIDTEEPARRY